MVSRCICMLMILGLATGNPARAAVPPTPRARPKPPSRARIAQARVARSVAGDQQTFQSSGFPTTNSQWPSYGGQSTTGAAGAKKSNSSAR